MNEPMLIRFLERNDIQFYVDRMTLAKARKQYTKESGDKVDRESFSGAVTDNCKRWKRKRRRPIRRNEALTNRTWQKVMIATERLAPLIKGRGLEFAVEVIRTEVSVSRGVLNGLPGRYQVWR